MALRCGFVKLRNIRLDITKANQPLEILHESQRLQRFTGLVAIDSADELGLAVGEPTLALLKVSSVILGVEA